MTRRGYVVLVPSEDEGDPRLRYQPVLENEKDQWDRIRLKPERTYKEALARLSQPEGTHVTS